MVKDNPTERNPIKAIRAKCLDCCCGQSVEVKLCVSETCPLFPFRFGKNPFRARRELSPEEKAVMVARLRESKKKP